MTVKAQNVIKEICSTLLIILFVYTATSKVRDYETYWGEINNQELDNRYTTAITIIVPTLEYLAAAMLAFGRTRRFGFYLSLGMMVVFTGYITLVLSNYYGRIPCSCGGVFEDLTWTQHLFVNIFFILVALIGSILTTLKRSKGASPPTAMSTGISSLGNA